MGPPAFPTRTGAQLLVDALRIQGVDTIFCVPGESFLSVLDALRDAKKDIGLIVCRHEGAAANMAEAYGKLTGAPGTIRLHQERTYPGRLYGTDLKNPDFAAFAQAFGARGNIVDRTEDFPAAFEQAIAAKYRSLLELRVDPDAITPSSRLSEITSQAAVHPDSACA
ncbi:MAG: hypothetical protein JO151_04330 [Verrucomicrobia bacterium]|nr:hypothetical protein [Verrucomicrobiota bacterium]